MTDTASSSSQPQTVLLYGVVDRVNDPNILTFAHDLDKARWLKIPRSIVSDVQTLNTLPGGQQRVALSLITNGDNGEGAILASIVEVFEVAIQALSRKVAPTRTPGKEDIDAACQRCLDACKLIVYPPEDPFGGIICMLSCSACP